MNKENQGSRKEEIIAVLGLFLVSVLWGYGFVALKHCEVFPPFMLNALRFLMASGLLALIFFKRLKAIDKELIKAAALAGGLIFLTYTSATIGIRYTSATRSVFFTCMEAMVVPIWNLILFRIIPQKKALFCVALCLVGIFLISMNGGDNSGGYWLGDFISFFASIFYGAEVILVSRKAKNMDPVAFSIVQLLVVGALALVVSFAMSEKIPEGIGTQALSSLLYLGIVASAISFVLQTHFLRKVSAHKGALVLTLEPVMGAVFTAIFLQDYLGIKGYFGGLLVFLAIAIEESNIGTKK